MIGFLKGVVEFRDDPYLFINVNGVGYKVLASTHVLSKIGVVGEKVTIFTYTHVREDMLDLYGFLTREDLKLFEMLLEVSGIGPKTAVGIFSYGSKNEIIAAIMQADTSFFSRVPRLGQKNAQKIIIELKNKIGSTTDLDLSAGSKQNEDVVIALKSLGFKNHEAQEAIRNIKTEGKTTEEIIRLALKYLGK